MGSMFRRVLSMLLAVSMVFSVMAMGVSAAEDTNATATEPVATEPATVGTIPPATDGSSAEPETSTPPDTTAPAVETTEAEISSDLTITGISLEPLALYVQTRGQVNAYVNTEGVRQEYYHYYWFDEAVMTFYFSDGSEENVELGDLLHELDGSFEFNGSWHVETDDDQSINSAWQTGGKYPVTVTLVNDETEETMVAESTVEIMESPVESLYVSPITLIEGMNQIEQYERNGTEEYRWNEYWWAERIRYEVTFKDGTSAAAKDTGFSYDGEYYSFDLSDDQDKDNLWGIGTHTGTVSIMGVSCQVDITVEEVPVESVELSRIYIPVDTNGCMVDDEVDGQTVSYYHYDWINQLGYTVYFTDGTSCSGQGSGFEYDGVYYEFGCIDDQSASNIWQAGNTYTVTVDAMGKEFNTEVVIEESPIASVTVSDVNLYPYTNGDYWEDDSGRYFMYYWWDLLTWTVTMRDGDTMSGSGSGFEYNGQWYSFAPTETEEQKTWQAGNTYDTSVLISGMELPVKVTIMESPIQSVTVSPVTLIEGSGCYTAMGWSETEQADVEYTRYSWQDHLQYTICFTDGTADCTGSGSEFYYNGQWIYLYTFDDQGPDSAWAVGNTYTGTVSVMGLETQVQISLESSPIDRIELQPFNVYKGMRTELRGEDVYDETTESWTLMEYERYLWWETLPYTVYFTDGTSDSGVGGGFNYNGRWYSFGYTDDQSALSPWQPGSSYTVSVSAMGKSAQTQVTVNDSLIQEIVVSPISIPEGTGGSLYNPGTEAEFYFYEWQGYMSFTVYFADGTSYSGNGVYFEYQNQGYNFDWHSDQSVQNPWTAGNTYSATVSAFGYETQVQVTITESPLVSLSIAPISIIEGTSGDLVPGYNQDTGDWDLEYYRYYWWDRMSYTATFSDGSTASGTGSSLYYNDQWYYFSYNCPQDYDNQWTVGNTYTVDVSLMGQTVPVSISITESPLQSITLTPATILENTNGGIWEDWVEEEEEYKQYYGYHWAGRVSATLTFTDGSVINTTVGGGFEYDGQWYNMSYTSGQSYANQWTAGNTYTVSASFMGLTAETTVTIEELPVQSVSFGSVTMKEYNNGYWTSQWIDNTEYSYFYYWWRDRIPYTVTFTDGSTVSGTGSGFSYNDTWISFQCTDPQSGQNPFLSGNTYAIPMTVGDITQDVYVTIYTSNEENGWEYMVQDGQAFITQCYNYNSTLTVPDTLGGYPVVGIISMSDVEYAVQELIIPDSVTMLSTDLFSGWGWRNNLRSVTIGAGVTDLSMDLFDECSVLEAVNVSASNTTYCSVDGVVYDMGMTTVVVFPFGKTGSFTIPTTVINADAIFNNLGSIKAELEFTSVAGYVKEDGVIYNEDKTVIYSCDESKTGTYVMPDSVTQINRFAFANSQLTEVTVSPNVTQIVYYTFNNAQLLEKVTIPESVTFIGERAFENCQSLVSADLPSNLQTLDMRAFANTAVQSVVIPASLKKVGWGAFYSADMSSLTISEGVEHIAGSAFAYTNVQSVTLPDSLTGMDNGAFAGCRALSQLTIGSGLQTIPWDGFRNTALTAVVFPENIQYIGGGAFSNCTQLSQVTFMNDAISFGDQAFMNCPIANLELGQGLTYIGDRVFHGSALTEVTIPDSVTEVGYKAFANSVQLMDIDLPESLETLYWNAFDNTAWYNSQPDGPLFLENFYYNYKGDIIPGSILNIPENITRFSTGENRLDEFSALVFAGDAPAGVSWYVPVTVVYPADNATWTDEVKSSMGSQITWIPALYSGTCGDNLGWALTEDGILHIFGFGRMYDYIYGGQLVRSASTVAPWYEHKDAIKQVVIGEDVEYLGTYSFADCAAVQITFASEAPEIGENAFYNMTATASYPTGFESWSAVTANTYGGTITWDALDTVVTSGTCGDSLTWTLDESGTLTVSGTGDMYGYDWSSMPWYDVRNSVKRVVVEEGVTSIGMYAFAGMSTITSVKLPDSLHTIAYCAFSNCAQLAQVDLPEGLLSIEGQAFNGCTALTQLVIPNSVTFVGSHAFASCNSMTQVTVGSGVATMGEYVFAWCESLQSVTVSEGVTSLGRNTFYNCAQLSEVILPQTVTAITYNTFRYCYSLTELTIPDGVTEIAYNPFWESGLREITIPQSVTEIGYAAFKYAWNLNEITFTGSAPSIDATAFTGVDADVYYPGNDESWDSVIYNSYGGNLRWYPIVNYVAEGTCGDNMTWHLSEDGYLEFKGGGLMYDYEAGTAPWYEYADLIQVVFLNDISTVGDFAFYGCANLQSVNGYETVVEYGDYSFYRCTSLQYVQLSTSLAVIGDYAFAGCSALDEFPINDSLKNIGDYAFEGCYGLRQVILHDELVYIGQYAFSGCTGLEMARVSASLTEIPNGLFSGCMNLVNVYMFDGITYIGAEAFMNCKSLTEIDLPDTVDYIGDFAFFGCSGLSSMTIPKNVEYVGSYAMHNCTSLTEVWFNGEMPAVGYQPLSNVTATVKYPGNLEGWSEEALALLGGNVVTEAYVKYMAVVSDGEDNCNYYGSLQEAVDNCDPSCQYVYLTEDQEVQLTLNADLYLDLNGYDLTGTVVTNGYKIYGMDQQTDDYDTAGMGIFSCVDENGIEIVPEKLVYVTDPIREAPYRYMAIRDERGWSFHRYYLGITHTSLKVDNVGLGYKATFCGDEMVAAQLDSLGYMLQLDGGSKLQRWKSADGFVSGQTLTLRVKNWDVENHGETTLNAQVALKLTDGTVIESALYDTSLRQVLENVNANYTAYSETTLSAVEDMINAHPIMKDWIVDDLYRTEVEVVEDAYALAVGETMSKEVTLTGTITQVNTVYSSTYGNITVTIAVEGAEDLPIQCYRLKGDGVESIGVNDIITVKGNLTNYNGTIEFTVGCILQSWVDLEGPEVPTDPLQIVEEAYALEAGVSLSYTATLTGVITQINTAYSSTYNNVTVTMAVTGAEDKPIMCYRLKGDGADQIGVGDTITVTGTIKNYYGTIQFIAGCTLDSWENTVLSVVDPSGFDSSKYYVRSKTGTMDGQETLYLTVVNPTGGIMSYVYTANNMADDPQEPITFNGKSWYGYAGAGDELSYSLTDTQVVFSINDGELYIYCELLENGQLRVVSADSYMSVNDLLTPYAEQFW